MPMSRHYKCFKCGEEFEILWPSSKEAQNTATCGECGNKAKRLYGTPFYMDDWSPSGTHNNQAQRDIEHFEKRGVKNGKYYDKRTMYREDRMKQDISMNLKEV